MNIETYAISGIVIIVPDISVTFMLDQLILIHLNICRASAGPPASQSTVPHFPSSLDGMRNRKV